MLYPMPNNGVIEELRDAVKSALIDQQAEIEKRLALFGLSFSDIPTRLLREQRGNVTRYLFDGNPILETEVFFTATSIRFEIRALS